MQHTQRWIFHGKEDQFRVNTYANVHIDTSETIEEASAVEELMVWRCLFVWGHLWMLTITPQILRHKI
jgi:hypothetical protein